MKNVDKKVYQQPKNILSRFQLYPGLGHYTLIILGMVRKILDNDLAKKNQSNFAYSS